MRFFPIVAASLALTSCVATTDAPREAVVSAPNAGYIEGDVRYLASDALEGRETGTRGFETASDYVASRFAAVGLMPAGQDGTWFQRVPLRMKSYGDKSKNKIELSGPNAPTAFTAFDDYIVTSAGDEKAGVVDAPLVFVGQGFVDPRTGRDDFAGVDLNGKIAVALRGAPKFLGPEERAYFNDRRTKAIAERGAVGLLSLNSREWLKDSDWSDTVKYYTSSRGATWRGPDGKAHGTTAAYQAYATVHPAAGERLMAKQPVDLSKAYEMTDDPKTRFKAFDMGITARMTFDQNFENQASRNVIGMIEGTDPELKGEYVVLTAHLDHLGITKGEGEGEGGGDRINNGALDNASGVAMMLDVARRLAANPPRRSVLFIALTAEEMGLVGSSYNAHFPTVPADSIAAVVNIDMPMVTYPFTDVVAYGAERSTLFPVVDQATRRAGVTVAADPHPDEGLFTRSDHYSYVEAGIPAVYLDTGPGNGGDKILTDFLKDGYHEPSDEIDRIDFAQAARFAEINYEIALGIANMDQRPVWKKDDFFATVFDGRMEGQPSPSEQSLVHRGGTGSSRPPA
ncbi:M28 family peptidase [Croceicoccus ponticola]|uniref:M28 family peptidase n=1 Tax=Croceicoccus ponticola TaxID=2217664 RepID=A0A437GZD5_9SPHN|nr:M28 family peptidase [Croceicoccus ponticola]RVQ68721.1 M28 family peptidase [Croceicoccus ponticola]